jgi:hypothetical protein
MKRQLDYLKFAEMCLEAAKVSGEPRNRRIFLMMANDYLQQANEAFQSEKVGHPNGISRRFLN